MLITTDSYYRGYPIDTGIFKTLPCYISILDDVIDMVEEITSKYAKVLFVRLDVMNERSSRSEPVIGSRSYKNFKGIIENYHMIRIIENVKRKLERDFRNRPNKPSFKYIWAREQTNELSNPHYHLFAAVNGNSIHNGYRLMADFNYYVQKLLGTDNDGLVQFSDSNGRYGIMADRRKSDYNDRIERAVYAGSYLAKVHSKEWRPKYKRRSLTSRIW